MIYDIKVKSFKFCVLSCFINIFVLKRKPNKEEEEKKKPLSNKTDWLHLSKYLQKLFFFKKIIIIIRFIIISNT
jgi:hypothetical protein